MIHFNTVNDKSDWDKLLSSAMFTMAQSMGTKETERVPIEIIILEGYQTDASWMSTNQISSLRAPGTQCATSKYQWNLVLVSYLFGSRYEPYNQYRSVEFRFCANRGSVTCASWQSLLKMWLLSTNHDFLKLDPKTVFRVYKQFSHILNSNSVIGVSFNSFPKTSFF